MVGEGAPLDIIDFHKARGTYINIANDDGLPERDHLDGIRAKWSSIQDQTASVLLAVCPESGMYVYTSKAMWMRTAREMAKLHPKERASMMDATFKVRS